ncbi:MAG: hypothetical protein ACLFSG_07875, partial [Halothiobacillaceae bacterium]
LTVDNPNFRKTYSILVTDAAGAPVEGAEISLRAVPNNDVGFFKGEWVTYLDGPALKWKQVYRVEDPNEDSGYREVDGVYPCPNEDQNYSGIIDSEKDLNGNGELDPGNLVTFSDREPVTDETGFAIVDLIYPQSYARWAQFNFIATIKVDGTESRSDVTFVLPANLEDINNGEGPAPSANPSPFGAYEGCDNTN